MAAIFILAGSLFGLASALASILLMGTGLLAAFAIWTIVGLAFSALGLLVATLPRREAAAKTESAGQLT